MMFFSHLAFYVSKNAVFALHFLCALALALLFCLLMVQKRYEKRTLSLLTALIGVTEMRDPNLEGHSLHVRNLSMLLYDNLPWSYRVRIPLRDLQFTALLLDVGKLCIPSAIIEKSGKLKKK